MRLIVMGQQAFGKEALAKLLEAGVDEVVAVYCAPDKEGRPVDPLKELALEKGLPVHQPADFKGDETLATLRGHDADLMIMAYVIDLRARGGARHPEARLDLLPPLAAAAAPRAVLDQLADHLGRDEDRLQLVLPDGRARRGRPPDAVGVPDRPGRHAGRRLFQEDLPARRSTRCSRSATSSAPATRRAPPRTSPKATYESWCRKKDAQIDWSKPAADVYNLIRGTNPQPGAWTTVDGAELQIFDARKAESDGERHPWRGRGRLAETA